MLNENSLPAEWGKGQGPPVRKPMGDGDLARRFPGSDGYGVGDGPDRDFIPRQKMLPATDGMAGGWSTLPPAGGMMRPAWGGARGVEPVHPGGEDSPIPGHLPPRRLDPGGVPVDQGGVLMAGADPLQALALELARQRQV